MQIASEGAGGSAGNPIQFAALCWRQKDDGPEVLLITSRDTGRWVLPKGWPMDGRSPAGAAAREAWEEAGVEGQVSDHAIGTYGYDKRLTDELALPCRVEVFALEVDQLAKKFPERKQRRRKWFSLTKAARKVQEPDLQALIANFNPSAACAGTDHAEAAGGEVS